MAKNRIKAVENFREKMYNEKAIQKKRKNGGMAQLVERLVRNEEASGSNPLISTIKTAALQKVVPLFLC